MSGVTVFNAASAGKKPRGGATFFFVPSNGLNKSVSGWANDEAVYCIRGVGCA